MNATKAVSVLVLGVFVSGCQLLTNPLGNPVIPQKLSPSIFSGAKFGTLSLTPERRVVLANFTNNRFCAEAPTEIGQNLASSLQAIAKAKLPDTTKAELGAEAISNSSNNVLNKRTQGMQMFLANSYFICQMYMNEAISKEQWASWQALLFNSTSTLILAELPYLYPQTTTTVVSPKEDSDTSKSTSSAVSGATAAPASPAAPSKSSTKSTMSTTPASTSVSASSASDLPPGSTTIQVTPKSANGITLIPIDPKALFGNPVPIVPASTPNSDKDVAPAPAPETEPTPTTTPSK